MKRLKKGLALFLAMMMLIPGNIVYATELPEEEVIVEEDVSTQPVSTEETEALTLQGEGNMDDPYLISTQDDLLLMAAMGGTSIISGYYRLENDIVLEGDWTPISPTEARKFTGTFDGQGYTISGVTITDSTAVGGLFGYNGGTIQNLNVSGSISTTSDAGLIAAVNSGTIEGCYSEGTVAGCTTGGISGQNTSTGTVTQSISAAVINGAQYDNGGLVGNNKGTILYCGATGDVAGAGNNTGGLVGLNESGTIKYSYALGNITSTRGNTGGFAGRNYNGNIIECYAVGNVNSNTGAGLAGSIYGGTIRFSYYNSANTGNRVGIPVTTAQLKNQETFTGWDFEYIWEITDSYPVINVRGEAGALEISGSGTEDDPYLITSEAHLIALTKAELPLKGKNYYRLENDIALTSENWTPIGGNGASNFEGYFDGQGYTISGLKASGTDNGDVGLFGYSAGTICNLTVQGYIEGTGDVGLIVGENAGIVEKCHTEGSVEGITIGGIVGRNVTNGQITQCTSSAVVSGKTYEAGGVVGYNGGTVIYCGATGEVSGSSNYVGGLVGINESGSIKYSYARGNVTSSGSNYGGLVGRNSYGSISYCYASGSVNNNAAAGLVGYNYGGTIRFSYYNSANTGNRLGIPATTTQLKKQETYTGWDFDHIWEITDSYPVINLRGEVGEIEISGTGTVDDPYQITSEEHLLALMQNNLPRSGKNYYRLENDIALISEDWTPIGGNGVSNFEGIFDGQGYTISGLKISGTSDEDIGLFGYNAGTILNLTVIGNVEGTADAGLIVGENAGIVENCHTEGSVEGITIGGIVGRNVTNGQITQCTSSAIMSGKTNDVGGIAGYNGGAVIYCGATGDVSGSSNYIGGLVGINESGTIKYSYAWGNVTSTGANYGGLVGRNSYGSISYCYAGGSVNNNTGAGLAGYNYGGTIRFCYYNSLNTGNRLGIPVTTTQLKKQETYTGWDFEHIWEITDGYPVINLRGEIEDVKIEGDGTEDHPYLISTEAHLIALMQGELPINGKNYYRLENNIALISKNWTPIGGNGIVNFEGFFDGQGYTISGLKISGTHEADIGLFGYNAGTIRNLTVIGYVEGTGDVGILVGENAGIVENCHSQGTATGRTAGGLVARNVSGGTITGSSSSAVVSSTVDDAGGLAGYNDGTISMCWAKGNVSGTANYTGGLVGINEEVVENCYARGTVTSTRTYVGGLIGRSYNGTVTNCYSTGKVNEGSGGGLIGNQYGGTVTNSYYCSTTSFCTDTGKGEPLTKAEMLNDYSYADWDFANVWGVFDTINDGFPFILTELGTVETEEQEFWYEAIERRKGYAVAEQEMQIFLKADQSSTIEYTVIYKEDQRVKNTVISAVYDEEKSVFAGTFHIAANMQEITSLTASVTDAEGNVEKIAFTPSFMYQIPLAVEGQMEVTVPQEIALNFDMRIQLLDDSGNCIFRKGMNGEAVIAMDGLPTGNYAVEIYGGNLKYNEKTDISVVQGLKTEVDLTEIPALASVELEFYADGKKLSADGITANFYDKTEGKSRVFEKGTGLNFLAAGDKIGYSISLSKDAQKLYRIDSAVYEAELSVGLNVIRVDLQPFRMTTVKVNVLSEVSGQPIGGAVVTVSQKLNGVHSYQASAQTDSEGNCEIQVKDVDAVVSVSRNAYSTIKKEFTYEELLNNLNFTMSNLTGIVEFNLGFVESQRISSTEEPTSQSLRPDKIELINQKTGVSKNLALYSWPLIYLDGSHWEEGDEFVARISMKDYETTDIVAAVNEFGNLYFEGTILQQGGIRMVSQWEQGLTSGTHEFVLYDEEGMVVRNRTSGARTVYMYKLPEGTYTLAAADQVVKISKYPNYAALQNDEELAGKWTSAEVTVEDGIINETDLEIPTVTDYTSILNADSSAITTNTQSARIGDYIHVSAKFVFEDIGAENKKLQLTVPEGTKFVESALTVNGNQTSTTVTDGIFEISIDTDVEEILVRYSVKVLQTVAVSELTFNGKVAYNLSGRDVAENLGNASVRLNELTIVAPTETNYTELNVHGVAPKNQAIEIYDDNILVGQTTSNKYGAYRASITLLDKGLNSVHRLKAVVVETGKESDTVEVAYGSIIATVLQFDVRCNAHTDTVYSVKDPTKGVGNITFTYNPAYPVTFVARFDNNQGVDFVKTEITLSTGEEILVDMSYNEVADYWEGTYDFDSRDMPVAIDLKFLPISFAEGNTGTRENVLENFKNLEVINDFSDDEEYYGYETEITLDDANQTKIRSLVEGKDNVEFTPDENYIEAEVDGVKYYFKTELVTEVRGEITYGMIDAYFLQDDGTYNLYRRGIGVYTSGVATYSTTGSGTASGNLDELERAFQKIYGSSVNIKTESEYALLLLDLLAAAESCAKSIGLEFDIFVWQQKLKTISLFNSTLDAYDLAKQVVDVEQEIGMNDTDNKIFDKANEKIAEEAQNVIDSMEDKTAAISNTSLNNLVKDMLSNSEMKKILSGEVDCEPAGESILETYQDLSIAKVKTILDPSGYVYETFEDNRLAGVTAKLYFENDEGYMEFWDAEEYAQINPQITDSEGKYGWDVPEGLWQVIYSKDGYATAKSEKLVVPPPQLDVNIEMVSNKGAQIIQQICTYNRVTLVFDKYVQVASLTNDKFVVEFDGQMLDTVMEIKDDNVKTYQGKEVVKSVDLVLKTGRFSEGTYQISVSKGIMTYSGTACDALTCDLMVTSGEADVSYTITIPEKVAVMRGEELLENGAAIYCNDRLQITAKTDDNEQLDSLTINGNAFESGAYYTVTDENLIVDVAISKVENRYRMAFDSKGGSLVTTIENVVEGTLVTKPTDPVKKYSTFEGWYIDETYQTAWDFETDTLNENLILYAKWNDVDYHITLEESSKTIYVGEELKLNVSMETDEQEVPVLVWKSSDEEVLTVTQNGIVTAIAPGEAQITVAVSGRSSAAAVCDISVSKKEQKISATDVYSKTVGDAGFYLDVEHLEGNGDITYESSDSSVAQVSRFGRVNIGIPGTAQIKVLVSETEEYAATEEIIIVNVSKGASVLAGETEYTIKKGSSDFYLNVYLEEGEGELTYESADTNVATVSDKGLVHAVAAGETVITVTLPETDRFSQTTLEVQIVVEEGESGGTEETKFDFTECEIELSTYEAEYTGSEICPTVTVTYGENILVEDTDYSVFYRNNINAGTATVLVKGKGDYTGSVAVRFTIKAAEPVEPDKPVEPENPGFGDADVYRIAGKNRYETSLATADVLKAQQNDEKFNAVILANGRNFPDALAGSYLAGKLNAPILMANEKAQYAEPLRNYIRENLVEGGTIYILGGTSAVPETILQEVEGFNVKRLAGASRYETNLMILEEAGVTNEAILVCTGRGFADSLSASATGNPILLVGKTLTAEQEAFMAAHQGNQYYVIGGEGAVSKEIEAVVNKYGTAMRIAGSSRYETSILVAETFFENPETAVLASAKNFPDGLCGGPLAMSKNAPLILTATGKEANAVEYAKTKGIHMGAVLGGTGLISDEATNRIFESTTITEW